MAKSVPGEGFEWHDGHGKAAKRAWSSENGGEIALDSPETDVKT